ncbi:hypothetical protein OE88DRAFT_1429494 [Heliocybe sulcata]|uniref:Uncharacterized protein n=1 Tax=Heliocybe sulcata TaxID=5364 RepID=A0A5C3N5T7_9AGAM|nr:hypothetical protein OE88DRAFT_1429494 [Heliocybe sulcata]
MSTAQVQRPRLAPLRTESRTGKEAAGKLGENCKLYPVLQAIPLARNEPVRCSPENSTSSSPPRSAEAKRAGQSVEMHDDRPNTLKKSRNDTAQSVPVNYGSTRQSREWFREREPPRKTQSMKEHGTASRSRSQEPSGAKSRSREPSSETRPSPPRHGHSWHHTIRQTNTERDRYGSLSKATQNLAPSRSAPPPPAKRSPTHTRTNSRDDERYMRSSPRDEEKHTRSNPRDEERRTRSSPRDDDKRAAGAPSRPVPRKAATMPLPTRENVHTPLSTNHAPTHAQLYNLPPPKLASVSAKMKEKQLREYEYSHPLPPTPVSRDSSKQSGPPPSASSLSRKEAISRSGRHSRSSNRM